MSTIYFIRHGQASFGAENYDELSLIGQQQACLLGQHLQRIFKDKPIPLVMAGSMQRHQHTAQLALNSCVQEVSVLTNAAWNEFNHQQVFAKYDARFQQPAILKQMIIDAGNPRAYLSQIFSSAIERWTNGEFHSEYDESWLEFKTRVEIALDELCVHLKQNQTQDALVFSSGGVISVVLGKILGLTPEETFGLSWEIANASITQLSLLDGELKLSYMGEHDFISNQHPELLTWM